MEITQAEEFAIAGESCPGLRIQYDVGIREFVVLASICRLGVTGVEMIVDVTGLSRTSAESCLEKLLKNGLVRIDLHETTRYAASTDGLALIRRAG